MIIRWKRVSRSEVQVNQIIKVNNLYHLVTKVTKELIFTSNNNRFKKSNIIVMRAFTKTYNDNNELITIVPHYSVYQDLFKVNKVLEFLPEFIDLKVIGILTKVKVGSKIQIIDAFIPKEFIEAGNYIVKEFTKKTVTVIPDFQPSKCLQIQAGMDSKKVSDNTTFDLKLRRNQISIIDNYNKQYLLIK